MTTLTANSGSLRGNSGLLPTGEEVTAISLLAQLNAVDVIGRQMFERDCLGYSFSLWNDLQQGEDVPEVTMADVLEDITDIRALPENYPDIREVDPDLLEACAAIEAFIGQNSATVQ